MLKINFKEKSDIIFIFIASTLIIIFLFGIYTLYILPIIIALIFLLLYSIEIIEFKENEIIEKEKTINALKILYLELKNNNSVSKSISNMLKKVDNKSRFYNLIKKFEIRRQLGEIKTSDFSIDKFNIEDEKSLVDIVSNAVSNDNISILSNLYKKLDYELKLINEKNQGSLNKYIIINTLFNSIIPSLLIFGFISYSIFSNFLEIMPIFSFILLILLPALSLLVNKKMSELNG